MVPRTRRPFLPRRHGSRLKPVLSDAAGGVDAAGMAQGSSSACVTARAPRQSEAATSTIASTSTAAPSGSAATPTAERAWRPASPNSFTISSLAPLATLG